MEWFASNWQFLIGNIIVPFGTAIIGFFAGRAWEKHKNVAIIKGDNNKVLQENTVNKDSEKSGK